MEIEWLTLVKVPFNVKVHAMCDMMDHEDYKKITLKMQSVFKRQSTFHK